MRRLAIVITHPIQYYAPVFQLLSARMDGGLKVFYTVGKKVNGNYDKGFGRNIDWNIPLLKEYEHEFVENTSNEPGTHHFHGIVNPTAIEKINDYNPHAILIYGWSCHSHLKIIRHFSGRIPVWFRGDSTLLDESGMFKKWFRHLWLRWLYRHIDLAFYTGTANLKYFLKAGLKIGQLKFAPHAIDNDRFALTRSEEVKEFRNRLQVPPDGILILFAGKFEDKKDPLALLRVFSRFNNDSLYLLFVGNGKLENKLKSEASENKEQRIFFMEFQNQQEMPVVYQACDLFCLPSKGPYETWGLAVNEAMAAGKAVVVSDKAGCSMDLVQQNVNGAVFKAGDEDDFFRQLSSLSVNKKLLMEMGMKSRKMIQEWSFSKQVDAILKEMKQPE